MSKGTKLAKYSKGRHWMPKGDYEDALAHVKRSQDKAVRLRSSNDTSPRSAHILAFYYHSTSSKDVDLLDPMLDMRDDNLMFASRFNVDSKAMFHYHDNNIVSVLRDKKNCPSPRIRFSLCGFNTKATRDRLNRYAVDLGVKFYCWRKDHSAWAIWVHDGTVFWGPIDSGDSILATNE